MYITKTTRDKIQKIRTDYFNSLPEFQELYIELMIRYSNYYIFQVQAKVVGYAIITNENVLIEFYLLDQYIPDSNEIFTKVLKDLSIKEIYCKSFDALLLSNCLINSLSYSLLGVLYRDYSVARVSIKKDSEIEMQKADYASMKFLQRQDDSIKELFETEEQLSHFIQNENVFIFSKSGDFVGCGMVLRTHIDWDYCDLGVWVEPSKRRNGIGSQIILKLREFAIDNNMKPSCACAIENVASQKTIEKSGFVSKYKMINFST